MVGPLSEVASGNLSTASTYALQVQAGRGSLPPQVFHGWSVCEETKETFRYIFTCRFPSAWMILGNLTQPQPQPSGLYRCPISRAIIHLFAASLTTPSIQMWIFVTLPPHQLPLCPKSQPHMQPANWQVELLVDQQPDATIFYEIQGFLSFKTVWGKCHSDLGWWLSGWWPQRATWVGRINIMTTNLSPCKTVGVTDFPFP